MIDINLSLLLPEIIISLAAMALLLAGAWWEGKPDKDGLLDTLALGTLALVFVINLALFSMDGTGDTTFGGQFVADPFSTFAKALMILATALPLVMGRDFCARHKLPRAEFLVLTLFALLGAMVMASAGGFMALYLGLELMSLSIYVLAAYQRDDLKSNESGLKYFVLGSVASGLLLYGVSLIYGSSGATNFAALSAFFGDPHLHVPVMAKVGVAMITAGLAFKIAAAPFHMWAPDVYEGAPTPVTAFMAAMPKIAAFAAIFRILAGGLDHFQDVWGGVFALLAILSLAVGALAAIAQTNLKRMLAYSSIGHVGYALIGLVAGGAAGYQAVMVYITFYIFMNMGAFALMLVLNQQGIGEEIEDYKGLSHKRPRLAFLMALFMFSMAGIPPLAGFIGKFVIFMAAVEAHLYALAILGVLFSAVGAFYYLRIVKLMYFDTTEQSFDMPVGMPNGAVIAVCAAVVGLMGLFPSTVLELAQASVKVFL